MSEIIVTRLIELSAVLFIGLTIYAIKEISWKIKFMKSQKEWYKQSFEFNGVRYNKNYFRLVDGKIEHDL